MLFTISLFVIQFRCRERIFAEVSRFSEMTTATKRSGDVIEPEIRIPSLVVEGVSLFPPKSQGFLLGVLNRASALRPILSHASGSTRHGVAAF